MKMDITSAQYVASKVNGQTTNVCIEAVIGGETWQVPLATGNTMYDEIMRQVAAGTLTIEDAD
tara:strand:+ start:420 stop:608 length:189 start_codon:yes stop_codon:yes gene_type:complete